MNYSQIDNDDDDDENYGNGEKISQNKDNNRIEL